MNIIYIPTIEYKYINYPLNGKVIIRIWFIGYYNPTSKTQTVTLATINNYFNY